MCIHVRLVNMARTSSSNFENYLSAGGLALFEISHDVICLTSQDGSIRIANPRFMEITGYSSEDYKNEKFLSLIHPDNLPETINTLKSLHKEKSGIVFSARLKAKNSDYRDFEWVAVSDKKNDLIFYSGKDTSYEKNAERKTIQSSRIYSVGELTVGISSLLSNLTSIIGGNISLIYMQLDKAEFDKEELQKNIVSIENATQKLSRIIKGLRSFIRTPENDPITNVQLSHVITNVLGLCQERFRIYAVKLKIIMNQDLIFRCRATQLAQMFINLLNNSFEAVHSDRDGWVELEIEPQEEIIKISVRDSRSLDTSVPKELSSQLPKELINENSARIYQDQNSKDWKVVVELAKQEKVSMEIL